MPAARPAARIQQSGDREWLARPQHEHPAMSRGQAAHAEVSDHSRHVRCAPCFHPMAPVAIPPPIPVAMRSGVCIYSSHKGSATICRPGAISSCSPARQGVPGLERSTSQTGPSEGWSVMTAVGGTLEGDLTCCSHRGVAARKMTALAMTCAAAVAIGQRRFELDCWVSAISGGTPDEQKDTAECVAEGSQGDTRARKQRHLHQVRLVRFHVGLDGGQQYAVCS